MMTIKFTIDRGIHEIKPELFRKVVDEITVSETDKGGIICTDHNEKVKKITKGEEFSKCHFLEDIDICNFRDSRNIEDCAHNPYNVTDECLFYNANKIIGYLDEEELKKCM